MDWFVPATWIASGIGIYAGLQFCIHGLIRRKEQVHLAFGVLSLLIGLYTMFSAQWYRAETLGDITTIARFEMAIVCLMYPVFVWFLSLYTHQANYLKYLIVWSGVFGSFFVLNLFAEYSFLYQKIEMGRSFALPWGEVVQGYRLKTSDFAWPYYAATYSIFVWAFYRVIHQWRHNDKARAKPILVYLILQFIAVIHAELVDNLNLNSVYLSEYAFIALTVLVSINLAREMRKRSQELEISYENLRTETLRRMEYEHKLLHLANHDQLTDLPNRRTLFEQIGQVSEHCAQSKGFGAMMMLDLDNFKIINDSLGHDLGDQLLVGVASRLLTLQEGHLLPIRLGGDEFAIIFENLPGPVSAAEQEAISRARGICDAIIKPYQIGEHRLVIGMSAGISLFDQETRDFTEVLKRADMAMYRAKSSGRNAIEVFAPEMISEADMRLLIEKDMRVALEHGDIELYFQPQVDRHTRLVGAEVLVRWRHPELGNLSPEMFIGVAEETGLIHSLGEYVLRSSCRRLQQWRTRQLGFEGRLSVNVSPWQLNATGFAQQVRTILSQEGIDPKRLNLEITESSFLRDIDSVANILNELSALGLSFSIDDFGTGYSALGWLKNLSLHELKIDRMFVRDMEITKNDKLIETILAIAKHMQLLVVAEGVESEQQFKALDKMGCEYFQGYYISRPMPEQDFLDWIHQHGRA